jgi:hypothetical protein
MEVDERTEEEEENKYDSDLNKLIAIESLQPAYHDYPACLISH